jgi:hypothetical protein
LYTWKKLTYKLIVAFTFLFFKNIYNSSQFLTFLYVSQP